jgi:hypothetical protein
MQTRIAVRDATPHRFQIIPLREAKSRHNFPEARTDNSKAVNPRTQISPHLEILELPSGTSPTQGPCSSTNVSSSLVGSDK